MSEAAVTLGRLILLREYFPLDAPGRPDEKGWKPLSPYDKPISSEALTTPSCERRQNFLETVRQIISVINSPQTLPLNRQVMLLWLGVDGEQRTQTEIGRLVGVDRNRVRTIIRTERQRISEVLGTSQEELFGLLAS